MLAARYVGLPSTCKLCVQRQCVEQCSAIPITTHCPHTGPNPSVPPVPHRWRIADLQGLTPKAAEAQEYVMALPPRIRKLAERKAGE